MAGEPGPRGGAATRADRSAGLARPAGGDRDRGATATEYAILAAFIAVVVALAIGYFGSELSAYISHIASSLGAAF